MDRHLVSIEVRIEGRTGERVELDCLTLDELRLVGLDTESVERRGTVEEDGVSLDDILEDVKDDRLATINDALGTLDGLDDAAVDEATDDEGLVELGSHILRQTALVHLQLRTDDDDGAGGVVDALTEEVLAEASLLTLDGVGKRLEGTIAATLDGS